MLKKRNIKAIVYAIVISLVFFIHAHNAFSLCNDTDCFETQGEALSAALARLEELYADWQWVNQKFTGPDIIPVYTICPEGSPVHVVNRIYAIRSTFWNGYGQRSDCFSYVADTSFVKKKNKGDCGCEMSCPRAGNPINIATGNKYQKETDLSLTGPGMYMGFTRYYNSHGEDNGPMGYGWTHTYSENITIDGVTAVLEQADGREVHFLETPEGLYISDTGKSRVVEPVTGGYKLTEPNGIEKLFDFNDNDVYRLTAITDKNNNTQTLGYNTSTGKLEYAEDNFGSRLDFVYNSNRIQTLTTPVGDFTYSYDGNGNLTGVIKPDTTTLTYLYEDTTQDVHNLTGIINENGIRSGTYAYDAEDRAISSEGAIASGETIGYKRVTIAYTGDYTRDVTDSLGNTRSYELTAKQGIGAVKSASSSCGSCGMASSFVHDDRLRKESETDQNGNVIAYIYDDFGNILTESEAVGTPEERTTEYTYHPVLNLVETIKKQSVSNPGKEKVTSFTYDASGNMLTRTETGYSSTFAFSYTTTYTYNSNGQVTSIDGSRTDVSDVITYEYYPNDTAEGLNRGMLKKITNAAGHVTLYSSYNAFGQAEEVTDANSVVSGFIYDTDGRMTSKTTDGIVTTYDYDNVGNLTAIHLPEGRNITYTYTVTNLVEKIEDDLGNYMKYFYDTEGNKTREEVRDNSDTLEKYLDYVYDSNNRLEQINHPGSVTDQFTYDNNGNLTEKEDRNNKTTSYAYDALNRLSSVTQPGAVITVYGYDAHNNLTVVTDAENHETTYVYDDLGRVIQTVSPDAGTTTYKYDEAGNLITKTFNSGRMEIYSYDIINRLTNITYQDPALNVIYSYDGTSNGNGRLTGMVDPSGTYTYTYDTQGNLVSEVKVIQGVTYTTGYAYDDAGQLESITYPSGRIITYTPDTAGRINAVSSSIDGSLASAIFYKPFGPMTNLSFGNGLSLTRGFDQKYQIESITVSGGVMDLAYTVDAIGNITNIDDLTVANKDQTFVYDDLYRLTSASAPGTYGDILYTYDNVGNRQNKVGSGQTDTYAYNTNTNKMASITGTNPKTFVADVDGNILEIVSSNLGSPGDNPEYLYNAKEQRIKKTVNGVTTIFHYDIAGSLISETDQNGTLIKDYIYANGILLATVDTDINIYYYHNDHLSTPQKMTNESGSIVWSADYKPFGEANVTISSIENNFRFPGQYFDAETGLHYNWNRYYDPHTGRYMKADPVGLWGGINLYVYATNDPINWTDPEGLEKYKPAWTMDQAYHALHHGWKPPHKDNSSELPDSSEGLPAGEVGFWGCMGACFFLGPGDDALVLAAAGFGGKKALDKLAKKLGKKAAGRLVAKLAASSAAKFAGPVGVALSGAMAIGCYCFCKGVTE